MPWHARSEGEEFFVKHEPASTDDARRRNGDRERVRFNDDGSHDHQSSPDAKDGSARLVLPNETVGSAAERRQAGLGAHVARVPSVDVWDLRVSP